MCGVLNMKTAEEKLQRHFEKRHEYQQRAIARQREKQANPEWRQAQYEKQRERQSRYIERAKNKPCSRGLKGRTPRTAERSIMDKIGALPCIACYVHGIITMWSVYTISTGEQQQAHTPAYCHCVTITTSTQHQQQYALFMPG